MTVGVNPIDTAQKCRRVVQLKFTKFILYILQVEDHGKIYCELFENEVEEEIIAKKHQNLYKVAEKLNMKL